MDIIMAYIVFQDTLNLTVWINFHDNSPFIIVWDGIIIIRAGLYKNAKLKFYLELPRGFPKTKPELYFVSKVYHPLVNYETGHLDSKLLSPDWKGNSTISYNFFAWLKSIFLDHNYLQITDSFNPKAGSE